MMGDSGDIQRILNGWGGEAVFARRPRPPGGYIRQGTPDEERR